MFHGEHYYLCPEVVEKKKYDEKADIWALGVILREMTTLEEKDEADGRATFGTPFTKECVETGKYRELKYPYSSDVTNLLDAML